MFDFLKALGFARRNRHADSATSTMGFAEIAQRLANMGTPTAPDTDVQLTSAIRECEQLSWRLVRLVEKGRAAANSPDLAGMSAEKLSQLLEVIAGFGKASNQRARERLVALVEKETGSASNGAKALGEWALRNFQAQGVERLRGIVQTMTLFPEKQYKECEGKLIAEVKEVKARKVEIDGFAQAYDDARESEIRAANIDTALRYLREVLNGAAAKPVRMSREGHVGPKLARLSQELKWHVDCAEVLLDLSGYARNLFNFLRDNRAAAVGALGLSVAIPAAVVKQVLASIALHHDLAAADTISKLDPVDLFKFGLVTSVFAAGLVAILLSFRAARRRAQQEIANSMRIRRSSLPAGLRKILVSVSLACTLTSVAWCGLAYCYWKGMFENPLAFSSASATERSTGTVADDNETGLVSVTTFGNLRVFRCMQATCRIATQVLENGETVVLRADQVALELGNRVGGGWSNIATATTFVIPLKFKEPIPAQPESISAQVHVDGALSVIPMNEPPKALVLDKQSVKALADAIGAIRWPKPTVSNTLEIPSRMESALAALVAASGRQAASLSQLVSAQDSIKARTLALAQVAEAIERCAERRRARNALVSARAHVRGDKMACDMPTLLTEDDSAAQPPSNEFATLDPKPATTPR